MSRKKFIVKDIYGRIIEPTDASQGRKAMYVMNNEGVFFLVVFDGFSTLVYRLSELRVFDRGYTVEFKE